MFIKDLKKQENGSYTFAVAASEGEIGYLVNFAINALIITGSIVLSTDENGEPTGDQEIPLTGTPDGETLQ